MRKSLVIFGLLISIGLVVWGTWQRHINTPPSLTELVNPNTPPPENSQVVKIIDAVTIQLATGHIVRYIGIRPPNVLSQVDCFGKETLIANEKILGETVRLESEPLLDRSDDGAWVRYVWLDSPLPNGREGQGGEGNNNEEMSSEALLINEKILEGGFGFPVVSEDMIYGERMLAASRFASATGKGLWSQCEVSSEETPSGTYFSTQKLDDCVIKGKITNDQTKIYRTESCPAYRETVILQSQGDRWFCSEQTAQDEGFTLAKDCS